MLKNIENCCSLAIQGRHNTSKIAEITVVAQESVYSTVFACKY